MLFIKLAWRNLFRNKRRTFISGLAIGIGLTTLIFYDAMIIGLSNNMMQTATSTFTGEAQIHHKEFRETQEAEMTINNLEYVISKLNKLDYVKNFTVRTMSFGTISSPSNMTMVSLIGINPETEKNISLVSQTVIEGSYFEGNSQKDIIIGVKLAEILEVGLQDRIVVTVAQAETGDLAQDLFRVSGICDFGERSMNSGMAFVRLEKAQEMLHIGENAHEIAIVFKDIQASQDTSIALWSMFTEEDNEVISWRIIFPELVKAFELSDFSMAIIGLILLGIVVFVILNTLFMSLYERMFEFGVIRALGTRPFRAALLLLYEAGALAVISIIMGSILAFGVTLLFAKVGISYGNVEIMGVTMRYKVIPVFNIKQYIIYPIWVFLATVIIGIYPAVHGARIKPAEAMRRSF